MFVSLVVVFILACLGSLGLLFALLWVLLSRAPSTTSRASLGRSAAVVVLGDVGRSPRMCYHAQSLAEDGWRVAVVGYAGTPPPPPLRRSSVKHHHLARPADALLNRLPRTGSLFALISAPLKVLGQSAALFWVLSGQVKPPPELIIVQTPPALPTLFVVRLVGMLLGSKVIIDWHNLSHTILSLRFRPTSPVVRLATVLERWTGRSAFAHLSVTLALKQHLEDKWHVKGPVKVLYDRPPSHFRRATASEMHGLLASLSPRLNPSLQDWFPAYDPPVSSPFTDADAQQRQDRPALVVSSTSWTADEDFGMLLKAASIYEKRAQELHLRNNQADGIPLANRSASPTLLESPTAFSFDDDDKRYSLRLAGGSGRDKSRRASVTSVMPEASALPKMLIVVTGKGELREQYMAEIARLEMEEKWQWVRIRTAWLQSEEYPLLLGSADVGVSLHSSSSGMDLPMKVVDMLGCGTPVCALGFPCITELVQPGQNGLVFYTAQELAAQLESLLGKHPEPNWLSAKMSTMDSLFPDSSAASFPARSASPQLHQQRNHLSQQQGDLSSDVSRSSSPPPSPLLTGPPSPLPMFSLLASPRLGGNEQPHQVVGDKGVALAGASSRYWAGNWKRVVRPLLAEADEVEEAAERMAKWSSSNRHRPRLPWWPRRATTTILKRSNSIKSALSTPRSSHEGDRDEAGAASGLPSRFDDDSILPRSSPKQLRQRAVNRSQAWTGGSSREAISTLMAPEHGSSIDGIPGISISPAEAT